MFGIYKSQKQVTMTSVRHFVQPAARITLSPKENTGTNLFVVSVVLLDCLGFQMFLLSVQYLQTCHPSVLSCLDIQDKINQSLQDNRKHVALLLSQRQEYRCLDFEICKVSGYLCNITLFFQEN